jgi:hypothetical protein
MAGRKLVEALELPEIIGRSASMRLNCNNPQTPETESGVRR